MTIFLLRGTLCDGLTHPTLPGVLISYVTSLLAHTALSPPSTSGHTFTLFSVQTCPPLSSIYSLSLGKMIHCIILLND